MRKRLLLDVDGILTDFHSAVTRVAAMGGFLITPAELPEWDVDASLRRVGAPENIVCLCANAMALSGFNTSLEPDPLALEWLPQVMTEADVHFVTSPNTQCTTWISERVAWMRRHFGVEPNRIQFTADKTGVVGDVFVDDCPVNVAAWQTAHPSKTALLWNMPYNKTYGMPSVSSWEELLSVLGADEGT